MDRREVVELEGKRGKFSGGIEKKKEGGKENGGRREGKERGEKGEREREKAIWEIEKEAQGRMERKAEEEGRTKEKGNRK